MNYVEVQSTDTLERIAAAHDCTVGQLAKLNKLTSRMVWILVYFRFFKAHLIEGFSRTKNACPSARPTNSGSTHKWQWKTGK